MITSLTLDGVCGQTITYQFGRVNLLRGRNGSGKSTIKHGICYGFNGTDAYGARSPTHLISNGSEGLRLEMETINKAGTACQLTRTLTQKGSQSCGLSIQGARTSLSQADLSKKLGSSQDVFLSVFVPGFFMGLPAPRQLAVLTEVMPVICRRSLLQELCGMALPPDDFIWTMVDLTKRADLSGTKVTAARRQQQSQLDHSKGRLATLEGLANQVLTEPQTPAGGGRLEAVRALKAAWQDYGHRRAAMTRASIQRDQVAQANAERYAEALSIQKEIAGLRFPEVRPATPVGKEIAALLDQVKELPARPGPQNVPGTERCSTCGQVVGSKHREHVAAENLKAQQAYDLAVEAVLQHNADIRARCTALQDAYHKDEQRCIAETRALDQVHLRRGVLETKLASLAPLPLPSVPPEPHQPAEAYSEEEEAALSREWDEHNAKFGAWREAHTRREEARAARERLVREVSSLGEAVARLERVEDALRRLPAEELARQADALRMQGYRIETGERVSISREDGFPYHLMSTGQRYMADIHLSLKLDSLLKRPVGALFLDDADLIDDIPGLIAGIEHHQLFIAHVDLKLDRVEVTHV